MIEKQLITLEFTKILEKLAGFTMFSASRELALALRPSPFLAEVRNRQAETTEADRLLSVKVNLGVGGARDVRPNVTRARQGATLLALELMEIRQTLIAARELKRTIVRLAQDYPHLADIAERIDECPGVVNEIGQAIDERGEIKSSASPELARIRRELEVAHSRIMEKLNRLLSSTQYNRYLQEALITQREGRYVVPLRAEFKGKIQGIIHDQSASGATLFIEPLTTVELNNRWRQLQLDEEEEIRRILAALSELVGSQGLLIRHTVAAMAEMDLAFARAKYAHAIDAVEPILYDLAAKQPEQGEERRFKLAAARHPLLNPKTVVPIDVFLPEETRMLVITGPNTGGKTVSLKTIGLLAAMAQAGLRIPAAEGSTLPVFRQVFADIGDEQSIEQSLSTFSAHMTNIVQILEQCDERSLVILDELGAGTDPVEGSALARAILTYLLQRGAVTFVATHYSELKAYAHTTPRVANASMEFDLETLSPTYHLRIGLPGASNAFAIARRLGLSEAIIGQARDLVGEGTRQVEAMLAEIQSQLEAARQTRRQAEEERAGAEQYTEQVQQRLLAIETERRDILNAAREDARREIKAIREEIRALKEQAQKALEAPPPEIKESTPEAAPVMPVPAVEERLERLETEVVVRAAPPPPREKEKANGLKGPLRPGDKVFIKSFNTIGEVADVQGKQIEVQMGHFRTTVPIAAVELKERAMPREPEAPTGRLNLPAVADSPGLELDLRGLVTEEALLRLDQYLDQAFMAGLPWVRIIHGKGSGVLRQVVRQELGGHALIASYRSGEDGEGGEGVTVAKLALH